MAWIAPAYSKERVKKAGQFLVEISGIPDLTPEQLVDAYEAHQILSNWRSSHSYPVNTFQSALRAKLNRLGIQEHAVAQRLKRTPSIINKLILNPRMSLSRMQDIAGLRAVVPTMADVRRLVDSYSRSRFKHELLLHRDYINRPKESGYRGVHLIYKYNSAAAGAAPYQGLQVEIQIRNRLQHAWATAVETAGLFLGEALKSSIGSARWLEFFSYASSSFALMEDCPVYEGHAHLSEDEIFERTVALEAELQVIESLRMFTAAANFTDVDKKEYFLLSMDPTTRHAEIQGFSRAELADATESYARLEREFEGSNVQICLVSVPSVESLKRAYPNYFLDTDIFCMYLEGLPGNEWRVGRPVVRPAP